MKTLPNILMVITHDTGRHLGCYGRGVRTPNLDRLAGEGVWFTQAFCSAPQCTPSRASLLTGQWPHSHGNVGLTHRGFRLGAEALARTMPRLLAQSGYTAHLFGFQHEAPDARELGYQQVVTGDAKGYSCASITPKVLEFLRRAGGGKRQADGKQPFFAMVGWSETHRKFPKTDGPLEDIRVPPYLPDHPDVRRDLADLNESVRRADNSVGEILGALQETGLADNTLVIYTTDHGIAFPGAKGSLFDPGIEIALVMRGPGGFAGGTKIGALTSNCDILPTLLELIGRPVPGAVQGQSLLPLVRGETGRVRDDLFIELTYHAGYDPMRGVRTDGWKFIRSYEPRPYAYPPNVDPGLTKWLLRDHAMFKRPRPAELLFDLNADPLERNNLAGDPAHAFTLAAMRAKVDRWMFETNDPLLKGPWPLPAGAVVTPPFWFEPQSEHPINPHQNP